MLNLTIRKKRNGLPILSKIDINNICEDIIADYAPKLMREPGVLDVDRFVTQYLGLPLEYHYLSHCGIYLGITVFNDTNKIHIYNPDTNSAEYCNAKAGTIIIEQSLLDKEQDQRYRFTVGHEAAHAILHKSFFRYDPNQLKLYDDDTPILQCRIEPSQVPKKPAIQWSNADWMEWQANRLSSAILMPKKMVEQLINSLPNQTQPLHKRTTYVMRMKHAFNFSAEAATYRLQDLKLYPPSVSLDIE